LTAAVAGTGSKTPTGEPGETARLRQLHVVRHQPHAGGSPAGGSHGGGSPAAGQSVPAVVLVHGSLDRGTSFARVVRRLDDLTVITYDRRGYHRSRDAGVARDLSEHVADLLAVVGAGPAVVVGHSLGGDVAIAAAIESPGTIRAVGAYEPPLPWFDWWPNRSRGTLQGEDPGSFAEGFFRRMVGDAAWERLPEATRGERRADGPALVAELLAIRVDAPPFDIERLTVPAVLARGSLSVPHHRRASEVLATAIPGAELVEISGAGHGAHLTHPDAFATFVRRVVALGTTP